ncbi:hypothetical protein ACFWHQ_15070 [Streptomyces sp. NPDC060334]|uniref:hypothetical protein n=1 Tax=Streptomyces sp. NPDC060334 TaxID=3347099 RepID=UPI003654633D
MTEVDAPSHIRTSALRREVRDPAGPMRQQPPMRRAPVRFIDGLPAPWSRRKPSTGLVPARQAAC